MKCMFIKSYSQNIPESLIMKKVKLRLTQRTVCTFTKAKFVGFKC